MPFDWQILLHKLDIDLEWELEDMGLEPTTQIKSDYAAFCWNEFHEPYYTTRNLPSLIKSCDIWHDIILITQTVPGISGFYTKRLALKD